MDCKCKKQEKIIGAKEVKAKKAELVKLDSRDMGWTFLFKCNDCDVYWELTYPNSEYHGGGEPELTKVDDSYVKKNYPSL